MTRFLTCTLLTSALLLTTACKNSQPEDPQRFEVPEIDQAQQAIEPSITTPLSKRQLEYQEQARETITAENAVEILTELEQAIQRDVDALQLQFDELGLELPED